MVAGLPAVASVSPASSRPSFTPTARSVPGGQARPADLRIDYEIQDLRQLLDII